MFVIGIEGQTGSGKTTLANYLKQLYKGSVHIEADSLVKENKLYGLRNIILSCASSVPKMPKTRDGRLTRKVNNESDSIEKKLPTPLIFRVATDIYYRVLSSAINKKLKEYQDKGVEVAIVDYALLNTSKIWKEFDYRICIFRDYDKRVDAVMKRDGKKIEKINFLDSFSKYNIIKYGIGDVLTIYNNGSMEELIEMGNKASLNISEKLKERRKISDELTL